MATVLVLLADRFEELEAIATIDILRRANLTVITASLADSLTVTGSHQITVLADIRLDTHLDEVDIKTWLMTADALVLPGGPGVQQLRQDERVLALARAFYGAAKLTAAICAAPLVLSDVGLLAEHAATSWPGVAPEIRAQAYSEARVVRDAHVITSRGAGTAVEFALTIVAALVDQTTADQIALAIVA